MSIAAPENLDRMVAGTSILASQLETAWTIWIGFYTATLTANVVAYGFLLEGRFVSKTSKFFAWVFIFVNLQTVVTCIGMASYTWWTCNDLEKLRDSLGGVRWVGMWACIGNALICLYLACLWNKVRQEHGDVEITTSPAV